MNESVLTLASPEYSVIGNVQLSKVDEKTFAILYGERIFYIGEILFDILQMLKSRKSIPQIKDDIFDKYKVELTEEKIEETIADCLSRLENKPKNKTTLYVYIYGRLRIIGEKTLRKITRYFAFLINKWVVITLFTVSFLVSLYFIGHIFTTGLLYENLSINKSIKYFLINYLFIIFAGMFHEIGHSSASARYHIHSKEIGFGFYLIFPVFYTDVSKIWLLHKYKRIVVNLAGIYFQFILSALIVAVYFLFNFAHGDQVLLKTLFLANLAMAIFSFNPFMRNDGYWIYSDLFNIHNLTLNARNYPRRFYKTYILNEENLKSAQKRKSFKKDIPLLIYSFFFHIIFGLLWVGLALLTYKNYENAKNLFTDQSFLSDPFAMENIVRVFGFLFTLAINIFFLYRILGFYVRKGIRKAKKIIAL